MHLAERAIEKSLEQCSFSDVKFLTHDPSRKYAVEIPRLTSLEDYSRFMIRDLHRHVSTDFALVVQWDGYVLNGGAWTDDFHRFDFGGAPFQPANVVGNGGFGLRSKKLLQACSELPTGSDHPEDAAISLHFRAYLEKQGIKFMPPDLARKLSIESRSWDGEEWKGIPNKYTDSLGFHSYLTPLPKHIDRPSIFTHSGDAGDLIYSLPALRALGGGVLFISPFNKYPYPNNSKWATLRGGGPDFVDFLRPLLEAQPYIWRAQYTHGYPESCDYDLNKFRLDWREPIPKQGKSILQMHMDAFNLSMPSGSWLTVPNPIKIPGKPIVVNRTQRYQNDAFPWDRFVNKWHDQIVFVGTQEEAELFGGFAPSKRIAYHRTKDALELAQVIAGAARFVGNQSLALAIAHGLGKPVCVEEWPGNANCRIERRGAVYGVPEAWLA